MKQNNWNECLKRKTQCQCVIYQKCCIKWNFHKISDAPIHSVLPWKNSLTIDVFFSSIQYKLNIHELLLLLLYWRVWDGCVHTYIHSLCANRKHGVNRDFFFSKQWIVSDALDFCRLYLQTTLNFVTHYDAVNTKN